MSKSEFTKHLENGMRVKHTAQIRFTVKAGNKVLEDGLTPAEYIGGAITRAGIMYNRLSMSGGIDWYDPSTGKSVSKPKYTMKLRPQDILTGDQLCDCPKCV